ncbi:hypothetical protein C4573_02785 [Candidatus Woesearchaeota archaeon]|nr:MAG: hypothetical protein C4573_02785 [Candidatus Woesearchaeota archaeon]
MVAVVSLVVILVGAKQNSLAANAVAPLTYEQIDPDGDGPLPVSRCARAYARYYDSTTDENCVDTYLICGDVGMFRFSHDCYSAKDY